MARNSRAERVGKAGLTGWRTSVGDKLAGPVSGRTPLSEEQVRAIVGAAFFALSAYYVYSTVSAAARELRGA
jgi:hypothetical protein